MSPGRRELRAYAVLGMEEHRHFGDRLAETVERKRTQLVVGLDPRLDVLPMELRGEAVLGRAAAASAVGRFCKGISEAVAPSRCA